MTKTIALLLMLILPGATSLFAQSADEKEVANRVETLRVLMLKPDRNALANMAAEALSYGHSTGLIEDKAAFVDDLVNGKTVFTSITLSGQTIKITGNIAIVRHRFEAALNNNNAPSKIDIIILMVWQKENGQWKLLARQGAKIPA